MKVIDDLIESARLLGATQAKRGFGVYTQDDSIMERSFWEGVESLAKAIRDEVAALKAERDELLKLINRRKIHPHDFPLEIFIADLSTRTANVLRAEFDSFRHTEDGTYDIEPPFTVRHLLMFSRQEIKKWPGIGKKGLNEIEENLRARGLQLWHAHDDRSLRLLREHKSYFVDPAKAKGVAA